MKMSLKRLFAVMLAVMTVATVFAGSAMAAGFVPFGSTANVNTNTNTSTESQLDPSKDYGKIVNVKVDVNFRSKASSSSSKVKGCPALPKDAVVEILGTSGSWYKLSYEGYVGYVKKSYVEKIEVPENTGSSNTGSSNNSFGGFGSNTGSSSGNSFDPFGNSSSSSSGTFNPFGGSSSSSSGTFNPFGGSSSSGSSSFNPFGGSSNTGSSNTQQEPAKTYGEIVNVKKDVNFRSKASNSASKVKGCNVLLKGAKVEILGTDGDWYKLSYNGYTGYVKQDYVAVISDSSSNTGSSNTGSTTTPAGPNISSTKAILSSTDKKNINAMGSNFASAQRKNSDAKGWVLVPGTNVNYPIMYRKDLNYYNDHTIDHVKKSSGSIYSFVSAMPSCGIYPVSGHNSRSSGTMFHELHDWQNSLKKSPSKTNRIAFIQVPGSQYTQWEVFAMYELKNNNAAKQQQSINMMYHTINRGAGPNAKEKQAWIDMQVSMSEVRFGTTASPNDQIVVLMTCGDNYQKVSYARLYFFLKGVA
ncbi:MAG: SH3 domain-containing protein [Clostridia bacterium]|nr:SH3 domain-containing protein [Clostridia bacterium]